jgi:hypothetical protein
MIDNDELYSFMKVCEGFVKSTVQLRDAAALCDDDPIKQDMIAFIVPEFHKMWARSEGIKVLLEKEKYSENREFILEEMQAVTHQNLEIAKTITDKLGSLT